MKTPAPISRFFSISNFSAHILSSFDFLTDYFGMDSDQRSFKKYLRSCRANQIHKSKGNEEIFLIESLQIPSNNVALSIFIESYSKLHNVRLIAYRMIEIHKLTKLKANLRHRFSILRALGAKEFLICGHTKNQFSRMSGNETYPEINTLDELEDFHIKGIHIGDLIYDLYLIRTRSYTINLENQDFWNVFDECLDYFRFWLNYFEKNKVKAICISHCVYHLAIPARIAIRFGVEVFHVQSEAIHRLDEDNLHAYLNSINLKKEMCLVPEESLRRGLLLSKSKLANRFSGKYAEELELSSGLAFRPQMVSPVKTEQQPGKMKVLIATHDFFDAVHFFGKGFYPDFFSWMQALSRISHNVDYEWYVKIHPDARGGLPQLVQQISDKSNNWKILPMSTSHYEIFNLGIDLALTIHGTIATEYPYFNIPVMNATKNSPYCTFDFSITPESRKHYEYLLENLGEQIQNLKTTSLSCSQSAIDRYFFARHVLTLKSWIYEDYGTYIKDLGGWDGTMSKSVYRYFLTGKNQLSRKHILHALNQFILSSDNRLERRHFPKEFAVNVYSK